MVRVFDLLHMGCFADGGAGVRLPFNREELVPGMNLSEDRKVPWPPAVVVAVDDEHVELRVGTDNPKTILLDYDHTHDVATEFDLAGERRQLVFTMSFFTVRIEEYDIFEEQTRYFYLDDIDWEKSEAGDMKAAQRIADEIAEQAPECLEIIAKYMSHAMNCGSKEAEDWLRDYHSEDGRWDAYV